MTEVTISEQMTRMTRRAIAIPFQFLCGGLLPTSSCRETEGRREDMVRNSEKTTVGAYQSVIHEGRIRINGKEQYVGREKKNRRYEKYLKTLKWGTEK